MRSKKALKNTVTSLLLKIVTIISGFIVPKLIISNFGSDINGLINSITQFLLYISLLESGIGPVIKSKLYKPIANNDKHEIENILYASDNFFKTIAKIFLLYIIILCFVFPILFKNQFDSLFTISLLIIISISTLFEYFFGITYSLFLQSEQLTYINSIYRIIVVVLNTIFIAILISFNSSILTVKLISSIIFIARPLLINLYVKKKFKINLKNADKTYNLKNKWDGLSQHIASVIHSNTDVTLLTLFCDIKEVSVYAVHTLVTKGINNLADALSVGIEGSFGDMIARNETDNLNKKFDIFEILYYFIITIIYSCTIVLIVPFVIVYSNGITDVNYIRPVFACLLVLSEYIWAIRLPYSTLVVAAGHFKETRKGAWVECISNALISLCLVLKFGMIGVTIGTIVAMLIRTFEFVYHTNIFILKRSFFCTLKKIFILIINTLIICFICRYLPYLENMNYLNWIINSIMTAVVSTLCVSITYLLLYNNQIKEIISLLKGIFKRKQA